MGQVERSRNPCVSRVDELHAHSFKLTYDYQEEVN